MDTRETTSHTPTEEHYQDAGPACQVITVATVKAQSAAADLLSSGDYCIAYPGSTILYHGVRMQSILPVLQPFTAERTSLLAHFLRLTNDSYAMDLARKAEYRFVFRFLLLRAEFDNYRAKQKKPLSDFECFLGILSQRLSENAKNVLTKARQRYDRYQPLIKQLSEKMDKQGGPERPAKIEADRLKAIIEFEPDQKKDQIEWTFKDGGGVARLMEDFYLVAEYIETQQSERMKHWSLNLGKMFLSKEDQDELAQIASEEERNQKLIQKVQPPTQPVLTFFIALCHALQEEDNELTATDAYSFGLIDEVWGNSELFNSRLFEEFVPDPPEEKESPKDEAAPAK